MLFLCVVLADVFAEVVVLVALGTIADGLFHVFFDTVKVVKQMFLRFFGGIGVLVDDVDNVLDLLATLLDRIVQRLPLPRLLLLGRKLAAREEDTQGCQYD